MILENGAKESYSNEYLLAKIGVDTAENEPLEVWGKIFNIIHWCPYVVRLAMNNATGAGQWSEEVEIDTVANPAQRTLNELMAPESEPVLEDLAELRTFHGGLYNAMKKSVKEMRSIKAIVVIQVSFQLRLR